MRRYVVLEKKLGETPLEAVTAWRVAEGIPPSLPTSYAGRLDPMATGKLLVLIGDECKRQATYTGLDKEYEIEVLLGVGSDTGDVLGIPESGSEVSTTPEEIRAALKLELGTHERSYPVFSSKTVDGKPLFLHALEGTLDTISIPIHTETIYRIQYLGSRDLSSSELQGRVEEILSLAPTSLEPSKVLGADFRIGSIRPVWDTILSKKRSYTVHTLRVTCGSGTYMRSLASRIGYRLGTQGLALSIKRTRIGTVIRLPFFDFWTRAF